MEAADLRLKFSTDGDRAAIAALRGVDQGIQDVEKHAKSGGGALRTMFSVAGGVALGGFVDDVFRMGKGFLMANANAEQARLSLETVTGSADKAGALFKDLQQFAKETPFEFPELVQSSINLESFGLKTMDWLPTIGDTAAAMGKSVDQVTQAVLDATSGQYERLKELGIQAGVEGDKLRLSYMKNGKQITTLVDKNNKEIIADTIQGIWNSKYAGAMEKQSHSFNGQLSTLKDNITMKMQDITGGIFEASKGVLSFFNDVFAKGLTDAIRGIGGDNTPRFLVTLAAGLDGLADSFRAVLEAFGSGRGLDAILAELPESFQGVVGPILAVADALGDMWAAFQAGGLSGVGDVIVEEVGNIVSALGDIAGGVVNVVVDTTVDVVGEIRDLLQKGVLAFIGYAGRSTGDPMLRGLGGVGISEGAPDLTLDIVVDGLVKLTGDLANIADAIVRELQLQRSEAQLSAANEAGQALGQDIANTISQGISRGITQAGGVEGQPGTADGWLDSIKNFLTWEPEAFRGSESTYLDAAMAWATGVGQGVRQAIATGLSNAFNGTETFNMMTGTSTTSGGLASWLQGTADAIIQAFQDLPNDIAEGVGDLAIDIPTPELPDWLTDFEWITGPVADLVAAIGQAAADLRTAVQDLQFWKGQSSDVPPSQTPSRYDPGGPSSQPGMVGGEPVTTLPAVGAGPQFTIPAPDMTAFNAAISGAQASLSALTGATYQATLTADNGDVALKYTDAMAWGGIWAASAFTGRFLGDNGDVAVKYTDAMGWGGIWGSSVFTGTFAGDAGPAAVAYTNAMGWGAIWAGQVFTASFSVDLSGILNAVAVARQAAADIAAVLPHSPAKEGPLREPINWGWLMEGLPGSLRDAVRVTRAGVGSMAGLIGGPSLAVAGLPGGRRGYSAIGGSAGPVINIDLTGAYLGRGVKQELIELIEEHGGRLIDAKTRGQRVAGSR